MALFPTNHMISLQENSSATGSFATPWAGGPGRFSAEATFGGGSVTLQVLSGNGTWMAVGSDTTLTAAGAAGFLLPHGAMIRAAIATATAVYAYADPIP